MAAPSLVLYATNMPTLNDVLTAGNTTSGQDINISSGDSLTMRENASVPGGSPPTNAGKLWVRNSTPNSLAFTNEAGQTSHVGLFGEIAVSVREFGAIGDGVADDTAAIQAAINAAGSGPVKTVVLPPGTYLVTSTIHHLPGVVVRGAGTPTTVIRQSESASPVWQFATGVVRGELSDLTLLGASGDSITARNGKGISVVGSQFVTVRNVEVWDFEIGIDLSDGTPYSAYNVMGPRIEVNRCTTGVRAWANCNDTIVFGSRIFYAFGVAGEGVGVDIVDASSVTLLSNTIESSDCCVRVVGSTVGSLRALIQSNYLEPGANPVTSSVGSAYDIDVDGSSATDTNLVQGFANTVSAARGRVSVRPGAGHRWDSPSAVPFGAMIGAGVEPKRNLIRNGGFGYWNAANVPDWSGANGVVVAAATGVGQFVTGVRSLQVSATTVTSVLSCGFVVSDPRIEWVTVGVRYRVLSGTGFSVTAQSGSNLAQRPDPAPADGLWRELHVTVRRDPGSTVGLVHVLPDALAGSGSCLVDEVWAVAGRHAVDSTQYGERVELLPAPLVIAGGAGLFANSLWGPIDVTNLPSVLPSPLAEFATAPLGVCGALLRMRLVVHDVGSGVLASHNWVYVDVPGAPPVVGSTEQRVTAIYANNPVEGTVALRATTLSGGVNRGSGALPYDYEIALVGWILR